MSKWGIGVTLLLLGHDIGIYVSAHPKDWWDWKWQWVACYQSLQIGGVHVYHMG